MTRWLSLVVRLGSLVLIPAVVFSFQKQATTLWLHVTVTDAQDRLVMGLLREQFEVSQAGRELPIDEFIRDEHPVAISVMMDVSGSMKEGLPDVARAAEALLDQFIPGDRANVGTFATSVVHSGRFTGNRRTIRDAIRDGTAVAQVDCLSDRPTPTQGGGISILGAQVTLGVGGRGIGSSNQNQPRRGGTWMWDAVVCGVQVVAKDNEAFRRIVLLITDGMENGGYATNVEALSRANTEGVMVFATGLRGTRGVNAGLLEGITRATGGWFVLLEQGQDFTPVFKRLGAYLHNQYVMSVQSAAGDMQRVTVRARNPAYKARSQRVRSAIPPR